MDVICPFAGRVRRKYALWTSVSMAVQLNGRMRKWFASNLVEICCGTPSRKYLVIMPWAKAKSFFWQFRTTLKADQWKSQKVGELSKIGQFILSADSNTEHVALKNVCQDWQAMNARSIAFLNSKSQTTPFCSLETGSGFYETSEILPCNVLQQTTNKHYYLHSLSN